MTLNSRSKDFSVTNKKSLLFGICLMILRFVEEKRWFCMETDIVGETVEGQGSEDLCHKLTLYLI